MLRRALQEAATNGAASAQSNANGSNGAPNQRHQLEHLNQRQRQRQRQGQDDDDGRPDERANLLSSNGHSNGNSDNQHGSRPQYYRSLEGSDDSDDESDDNEIFDEDDVDDDSSTERSYAPPVQPTFLMLCYNKVKYYVMLIADVENLWDSPQSSTRPRRSHMIVWFWFVVLTTSYTSERSSFKLLADWSGSFRLVAAQMVTLFHAIYLGIGIIISSLAKKENPLQPLGVPIIDVGLMALLDTVHILLVFLSGIHVPPTLTVILAQFVLPLSVFIGSFLQPADIATTTSDNTAVDKNGGINGDGDIMLGSSDAQYGNGNHHDHHQQQQDNRLDFNHGRWDAPMHQNIRSQASDLEPIHEPQNQLATEHVIGSIVIFFAVLLALCPAIYSLVDPEYFVYADAIPMRTAWNTIVFVSSCIPAAASQLYKERTFLKYKQPVQPQYLNFVLSAFQFIFASIIAPLVYPLQGLGAGKDWPTLYPPSGYSQNVLDGMRCFLRPTHDEDGNSTIDLDDNGDPLYAEEAKCSFIFFFVIWYTLSVTSVGVAVDKLVNAGATKLLYRGISAAVIVSVICLYTYDMHIPDFNYGPAIDSLNLVCLLLLVLGSEIYHRVSMPYGTFDTVFPDVDVFYDDEEEE